MRSESDLTSLNVSLPTGQRKFVEAEAKRTGCTTASECVRGLIREQQKERAREKLEEKIAEGLNSGDPVEVTREDWDELRKDLRKKLAARQRQE